MELEAASSLRPTQALVRDYYFDNPRFRAQGASATAALAGEEAGDYVYEEGALHAFDVPAQADVLMDEPDRGGAAQRRLQGERRAHSVVTCRTTCALPVGAVLTVTGDHPLAELELTVVDSHTLLRYGEDAADASGAKVTCLHRASCIPASLPFRPSLLPKPRIQGVQRATVIGSEHVDVDEHGRVLLMFGWDLAGDSISDPRSAPAPLTRRVSVAQNWAGQGHGFLTVPRAGDEVLVAYVDGDPDEPVVVGRVYNGHNPQLWLELPIDDLLEAFHAGDHDAAIRILGDRPTDRVCR